MDLRLQATSDLRHLAELIRARNANEVGITDLIGRPAQVGHIGEYIAARVFDISLEESAARKSIDGHFADGPLAGRSVNVKWYARQEGIIDVTPNALPDSYLVLTGPRSAATSSRGQVRPWIITFVYLFDAQRLLDALEQGGAKTGVATSVKRWLWDEAEIYPNQQNTRLSLSTEQRGLLALFG